MTEKKKKSKVPWIVVAMLIVVIALVAVIFATQMPSGSKQYVGIQYSTVAWYYTYPAADNLALVAVNVQVTNINYTDEVQVYASNPLSLGGFGLNIGGVSYDPHIATLIQDSSALLGWSTVSPTLQSVKLAKGGSTAGTLIFVVPNSKYKQ